MKKKKINWLLILQGWTMLWVVIGHSPLDSSLGGAFYANTLFEIAYSFHMPLFMLISGYLFYMTRLNRLEWDWYSMMKEKLQRLGFPFVVFTVIAMIFKSIFASNMDRAAEFSIREFINAIIFPVSGPLMELWFVICLLLFFSLFSMLRFVLKDWKKELLLMVMAIIFHFLPVDTEFLSLHRASIYFIWFYMGIVICEYRVIEFFHKHKFLFILIGVLLSITGRFVLDELVTIGLIIFSICFSLYADKYIPKLFSSYRNYTYQIFLMGIFAQILVKIMYAKYSLSYLPCYLLCIVVGLYFPVVVSILLERIGLRPLLLCVGLNKKVQ